MRPAALPLFWRPPELHPLRDLLTTWQTWTSRQITRRAMSKAATDEQRAALERVLEAGTEVGPLDALADVTELVALLAGWRWQVVAAAREQGQLGADHHCD